MTGSGPNSKFGDKAPGFYAPTQLPHDEAERRAWEEANKQWWEAKPMRYDWRDGLKSDHATAEFFREIDGRFFSSVRKFLPYRAIPFDPLIPYDTLGNRDVLEIGVGGGVFDPRQCNTYLVFQRQPPVTCGTVEKLTQ